MNKDVRLTSRMARFLCVVGAVWAGPGQAQELPIDAVICITKDMSPDLKNGLMKLAGDPPTDAERKAVNSRGGACQKRYGWSVPKAINALSYAGFHVRANEEREKLKARGVPVSTISDVEGAAIIFFNYSVKENDPVLFNRWLKGRGFKSMSEFRNSPYFPLFDAYAGTKIAAEKYSNTP